MGAPRAKQFRQVQGGGPTSSGVGAEGGGFLVQEDWRSAGSDALTGLDPVARAPPLASQLSLARTNARSRAFFRWRGFSTRTVSSASVASSGKGLDGPGSPGELHPEAPQIRT